MSSAISPGTILLLGGTGKVSSRIASLLSTAKYTIIQASRSGSSSSFPRCEGVVFNWLEPKTYSTPFFLNTVNAVFIIAPPQLDVLTPMKHFIDVARKNGVNRFVLLSASVLDVGDGPAMSEASKYITKLGVEYAILRPTWFMENFSEQQYLATIRDSSQIFTATGNGKIPFVFAADVAAVAFHALTDKIAHNTDHLILGPELLSYDEVSTLLTKKLQRPITHVKISENDLANAMRGFGIESQYAGLLAQLDTAVKEGKEERLNGVVKAVTGKEPVRFEVFVDGCLRKGVWDPVGKGKGKGKGKGR